MGRVEAKVALITGAARGQGRSHAIRLAEEGAQIIALDICEQIESVPYGMASREDLDETVRLVEDLDQRIVARKADVRDLEQVESVVREGVAEFGRLDIVSANAGIFSCTAAQDMDLGMWRDMIDTNLTGVYTTCRAAIPHLIETGGGSIVITSSTAGIMGFPGFAHYTAAKHGVIGLMKSLAKELAEQFIRVNCVCPSGVPTDMIMNDAMFQLFRPDLDKPTREDAEAAFQELNLLPIPYLEARDISNAVLFLASDEARYITSVILPVDAGSTQK